MATIAAPTNGDLIAGRPNSAPAPLRVLVAEDDVCNQQVLRLMLERRGCRVRIADNGRLALAALAEASFDLLLLDMRMPDVDGFHVVESLRRSERDAPCYNRLPVIAVTALATKDDRKRCMEAGVDEYLSKPFRLAALYGALDRALGSAQSVCRTSDVWSTFASPSVS